MWENTCGPWMNNSRGPALVWARTLLTMDLHGNGSVHVTLGILLIVSSSSSICVATAYNLDEGVKFESR